MRLCNNLVLCLDPTHNWGIESVWWQLSCADSTVLIWHSLLLCQCIVTGLVGTDRLLHVLSSVIIMLIKVIHQQIIMHASV